MRSRGCLKKFCVPTLRNSLAIYFWLQQYFFPFYNFQIWNYSLLPESKYCRPFDGVQPFSGSAISLPNFNYVQNFNFCFRYRFQTKSKSAIILFPLTSLRAVFNTLLHFISFNCIFCYFKTFQFFPKRSTPCIILLCCLARMDFPVKFLQIPFGTTR